MTVLSCREGFGCKANGPTSGSIAVQRRSFPESRTQYSPKAVAQHSLHLTVAGGNKFSAGTLLCFRDPPHLQLANASTQAPGCWPPTCQTQQQQASQRTETCCHHSSTTPSLQAPPAAASSPYLHRHCCRCCCWWWQHLLQLGLILHSSHRSSLGGAA